MKNQAMDTVTQWKSKGPGIKQSLINITSVETDRRS